MQDNNKKKNSHIQKDLIVELFKKNQNRCARNKNARKNCRGRENDLQQSKKFTPRSRRRGY